MTAIHYTDLSKSREEQVAVRKLEELDHFNYF